MAERHRIRKVAPGEIITAGQFNQLIDTINFLMQNLPAASSGFPPMRQPNVLVQILKNATGDGKYDAMTIGLPIAPIDPTKPVTDADVGDFPTNNFANALFVDAFASSGSGHTIPINAIRTGFAVGYTSEKVPRVEVMGFGPNTVVMKVTGNATMGGAYTARVWTANATIDVTASSFSGSILGVDPGSDNCYAINLPEIGLTTHDLTNGSNTAQFFFVGIAYSTAVDGKPVYLANGFWNEDCS